MDSGLEISCVAENIVGEDQASAELTVFCTYVALHTDLEAKLQVPLPGTVLGHFLGLQTIEMKTLKTCELSTAVNARSSPVSHCCIYLFQLYILQKMYF